MIDRLLNYIKFKIIIKIMGLCGSKNSKNNIITPVKSKYFVGI